MAILANPRSNHLIHLALLGTLLFFEFLTLAISAAFVDRGKRLYHGYYFDASGLIVAASVLTIIATVTFLVFNLVGNLYKGMKNSKLVEIVVFDILLVLNLAGAADLSSKSDQFNCSSKSCQLAKATLAFAWISTIVLMALLTFIIAWCVTHRGPQGDWAIYKSNIKSHYVDGEFGTRAETGMATLSQPTAGTGMPNMTQPAAPVTTSRPATPVVAAEPPRV
ncbi:hypothetical protein NCC49_003154 [Naganishia albida]|nr:hypothetical protein NCC49_003154 [Naganishia albida]